MSQCPSCLGDGRFLTECCSGAGECSCRGGMLDLWACKVCGGSGEICPGEFDRQVNTSLIDGLDFIGTGPDGMFETYPKERRGNFNADGTKAKPKS